MSLRSSSHCCGSPEVHPVRGLSSWFAPQSLFISNSFLNWSDINRPFESHHLKKHLVTKRSLNLGGLERMIQPTGILVGNHSQSINCVSPQVGFGTPVLELCFCTVMPLIKCSNNVASRKYSADAKY